MPLGRVPQHLNTSTPQHLNTSTPQHLNTSTPQHLNTSTPFALLRAGLNTSTPFAVLKAGLNTSKRLSIQYRTLRIMCKQLFSELRHHRPEFLRFLHFSICSIHQ
jgi:hypothetical protein